MPRTFKGRGQADLRLGEAGTSPQHRIKSYIRYMVEPSISDNRALKVAVAYPGRSAVPLIDLSLQATGILGKPVKKIPGIK